MYQATPCDLEFHFRILIFFFFCFFSSFFFFSGLCLIPFFTGRRREKLFFKPKSTRGRKISSKEKEEKKKIHHRHQKRDAAAHAHIQERGFDPPTLHVLCVCLFYPMHTYTKSSFFAFCISNSFPFSSFLGNSFCDRRLVRPHNTHQTKSVQ